jgi:peptidoglycan/LPS O-acetylase OafA/YrhL
MVEGGRTHSVQASTMFRADIEGLRALAILAVLGYHADVPGFGGGFVGVDVFFVISGFLITGLLHDEIGRSGQVDLANFFARRARRLLPASVLVLVAVALAGRGLLAPVDHALVAGDIATAALYVVNLRFAWQSTDYLAGDRDGSPVLHYWSLAVEEQFYLFWPLLLLAVLVWLPHGFGRRRTPGAAGSDRAFMLPIVAVCAVSFGLALWLTARAQPWSFFSPWTRAWEFGVGAAVFALRDRWGRLGMAARSLLGGCGLLALAIAVVRTGEAGFPGVMAWLPVLGAAALIAAGSGGTGVANGQVGRVLSLPPLRWIGRLSYSLYLWHWPVLVFAGHVLGLLHWIARLGWTLASVLPAALAYRFVEKPIHLGRSGRKRVATGLRIGALASCSGLAAAAWLAWPAHLAASRGRDAAQALPPLEVQVAQVRDDLPPVYTDGCHLGISATESGECGYGAADGPVRVVLMGDSKAAQWFPALEQIARERGWRFYSLTKSGCPAADVTPWSKNLSRPYRECDQWREQILQRLGRERPDLVLLSSAYPGRVYDRSRGQEAGLEASRDVWREGWKRTLARLRDDGIRAALLRNTPEAGQDMASCVSGHLDAPQACDVRLHPSRVTRLERDAAAATRTPLIDMTPSLCRGGTCAAVQDGVLMYRDRTHLTPEAVRRLAPSLGERRLDALVR